MEQAFFQRLRKSETVLLAGAGGGYDIFCGLPLYAWLRAAGKTVHLANHDSLPTHRKPRLIPH